MRKSIHLVIAGLLVSAMPAAAFTICTPETLAGEWRASAGEDTVCNLTIRDTGRLTGVCWEREYDPITDRDIIVRFNVRGPVSIEETCKVSATINLVGAGERVVGSGRVWGAATPFPELGMLISDRNRDGWGLMMYRTDDIGMLSE